MDKLVINLEYFREFSLICSFLSGILTSLFNVVLVVT